MPDNDPQLDNLDSPEIEIEEKKQFFDIQKIVC